MPEKRTWLTLSGFLLLAMAGCGTVNVRHEVAPIFVTVDVNIKVQEKLERFFDFERTRDAEGPAPGVAAGKGANR